MTEKGSFENDEEYANSVEQNFHIEKREFMPAAAYSIRGGENVAVLERRY